MHAPTGMVARCGLTLVVHMGLADDIDRLQFRAPAILVIGEMVRNATQASELAAAAAR